MFVARHIDAQGGQWAATFATRDVAVKALEARVGLTVASDWLPRGPRGRDVAVVPRGTIIVDPVGRAPYRGPAHGGL
jgi:hypothetical protein